MRTRICSRCGEGFKHNRRDPSVWCSPCRGQVGDAELTALVYPDASGIFGLYERTRDAFDAMREDAALDGGCGLKLVKVIGHAGAVNQVHRPDPEGEMWDRRDQALDRAEFERGVL